MLPGGPTKDENYFPFEGKDKQIIAPSKAWERGIVPSPRKFTEDRYATSRNPRKGAAILALPRLNFLCSLRETCR